MSEELKPCPFCGGPAEINVPGWVYADRPQFWRGVRCSRPPCPGAYIACGATEDSEEGAIAKITAEWNTRHADPATSVPPAAPSIQPEEKVFTGYSQGVPASAPSATSPAREWIVIARSNWSGIEYATLYATREEAEAHCQRYSCTLVELFEHAREVQPVTRGEVSEEKELCKSEAAIINRIIRASREWERIKKAIAIVHGANTWHPFVHDPALRALQEIAAREQANEEGASSCKSAEDHPPRGATAASPQPKFGPQGSKTP